MWCGKVHMHRVWWWPLLPFLAPCSAKAFDIVWQTVTTFCVDTCSCMSTCRYWWNACVYIHAGEDQKFMSGVFLNCSRFYFWKQGLSISTAHGSARLLAYKQQGSSSLLPRPGRPSICCCIWLVFSFSIWGLGTPMQAPIVAQPVLNVSNIFSGPATPNTQGWTEKQNRRFWSHGLSSSHNSLIAFFHVLLSPSSGDYKSSFVRIWLASSAFGLIAWFDF